MNSSQSWLHLLLPDKNICRMQKHNHEGQCSVVNILPLILIQGGPKIFFWCDIEEKCLKNSKIFFDGVFLSIYSHLLMKLELSKFCRKKRYRAIQILKMACSNPVRFFFLNLSKFFVFLKLTTRMILRPNW